MNDIFPPVPSNAEWAVPGAGPQLPGPNDVGRFLYMHQVWDPDRYDKKDAYKYKVPFEGEVVFDNVTDIFYKCIKVDKENLLKPTFKIINAFKDNDNDGHDYDRDIFGIEAGFQGEAILGVDYTVRPNRARVDAEVVCPAAAYALVYKGTTVTPENIISAVYSSSGIMMTKELPLELAGISILDNKNIMTTLPFSVTLNAEELPPGAKATLVWYDREGNPIARPVILNVQHTAVLHDHNIGRRYVERIELAAPWFTNSTKPDTMNIPINVQLETVAFYAIVHYSDGTHQEYPIDGKKIQLKGIREHTPSAPTQTSALTLVYWFDKDEAAYEADSGIGDSKRKNYTIVCEPFKGAYSPKLYFTPQFDGRVWGMRSFLTDLDRQFAIEATDKMWLNESSPAFRPTSYGVEQNLIYNVRLSDLSPDFTPMIFKMHVTVVLKKPTEKGSKWSVRYSYLGATYDDPTFKATQHVEGTRLDISAGAETVEDWLTKMYVALDPSYNPEREKAAPMPNAFELIDSTGRVWPFELIHWNQRLRFDKTFADGETLIIRWYKVDESGSKALLAVGGSTIEF